MSITVFGALPAWAQSIDLTSHLGIGIVVGLLYFQSLWRNVERFTRRGGLAATIAVTIGRIALLGGVLTLASLEGALPLLTLALGVTIGRFVVMRRFRKAVP